MLYELSQLKRKRTEEAGGAAGKKMCVVMGDKWNRLFRRRGSDRPYQKLLKGSLK